MKILTITKSDLNERNEYAASESLNFEGHIQIEADLGTVAFRACLRASGYIRAFAGSGIKAGSGIEAGWGIEAGDGIKAGLGIEAGLGIACKNLAVRLRIFAGLCMWRKPKPEEMEIRAEQIEGEVCYGTVHLTGEATPESTQEQG